MLDECFVKAAGAGCLEAAERLLMANVDINFRLPANSGGYSGLTALQAAAKVGHLKLANWLLEANTDVNAKAHRYSGRTALQGAAEQGHLEVIEWLLAVKVEVNAKVGGSSGRTDGIRAFGGG